MWISNGWSSNEIYYLELNFIITIVIFISIVIISFEIQKNPLYNFSYRVS
jgi:hypothetical protein